MKTVVVWKDKPGQLVSTMRTPEGVIVTRDARSLRETGGYTFVTSEDKLLSLLEQVDGTKIAVPAELARDVLGWDVP